MPEVQLPEDKILTLEADHKNNMTTRLEKFERRLAASRELDRLKKYLSLFGIGFGIWLSELWDVALKKLTIAEEWLLNAFFRLILGSQPKVSPLLEFLNTLSLLVFLLFSAWLVYWVYMGTYVRKARGEMIWSFKKTTGSLCRCKLGNLCFSYCMPAIFIVRQRDNQASSKG